MVLLVEQANKIMWYLKLQVHRQVWNRFSKWCSCDILGQMGKLIDLDDYTLITDEKQNHNKPKGFL